MIVKTDLMCLYTVNKKLRVNLNSLFLKFFILQYKLNMQEIVDQRL